jgi:pre-mRNA-processing factor 40
MPEDFRLWKERIEAIERKRSAPATAAAAPSVEPAPSASAAVATAPSQLPGIATSARTTSQTQSRRQATAQGAGSDDDEATVLAYSTREEAMDAFKALLAEKKVPTSMRFKEVMDLCQDDVRFNALKSAGEKKQALAEYQVTNYSL